MATTADGVVECGEPGCVKRVLARRMCSMHYQRWKKGTYEPQHDVATQYPIGLDEQFAAHTERRDGCLVWTGSVNSNGYGRVSMGKTRKGLAHRVAYTRERGAIQAGAVIDHTCHNEAALAGLCSGGSECIHRLCVDPNHMRVVTQSVNLSASGLVGRSGRGNHR